MMNREGMPLYDEAANKGFEQALDDQLDKGIFILKHPSHINDEELADEVVALFMKLWAQKVERHDH